MLWRVIPLKHSQPVFEDKNYNCYHLIKLDVVYNLLLTLPRLKSLFILLQSFLKFRKCFIFKSCPIKRLSFLYLQWTLNPVNSLAIDKSFYMSHSLLPGIQWIFAICFYGKELSGGMGEAVLILQSCYEILEMFPFLSRTKTFWILYTRMTNAQTVFKRWVSKAFSGVYFATLFHFPQTASGLSLVWHIRDTSGLNISCSLVGLHFT